MSEPFCLPVSLKALQECGWGPCHSLAGPSPAFELTALLSPLSVTLAQPLHLLACPSPGPWESDTTRDSKTRLV